MIEERRELLDCTAELHQRISDLEAEVKRLKLELCSIPGLTAERDHWQKAYNIQKEHNAKFKAELPALRLRTKELEAENKALKAKVEILLKTRGLEWAIKLDAENKALRIDVARRAGAALDRVMEFQDLEKRNKQLHDRMREMEEILDVYVGHTCMPDGKGGFVGAQNCPAHRWEELKANSSNFTPAT